MDKRERSGFVRSVAYGKTGEITLEPARVLLHFRKPIDPKELAHALEKVDARIDQGAARKKRSSVNHSATRVWVRLGAHPERSLALLDDLFGEILARVSPVYRLAGRDDDQALLSLRLDRLMVCPTSGKIVEELAKRMEGFGFKLTDRRIGRFLYFAADARHSKPSTLIRPELLAHAELVRAAAFVVTSFISPLASSASPNDRLYTDQAVGAHQWYARHIEAGRLNGAVTWGWNLHAAGGAGAAVKVAVIDEGVDLAHEDLVNQLVTDGGGARGRLIGDPFLGEGGHVSAAAWHGTAIAGLVAGEADNDPGLNAPQIAGISRNTKIVTLASGAGLPNADVALGVELARGLGSIGADPAWASDIVLLPFASDTLFSGSLPDPVVDAIAGAVGDGRVVVVAAGNSPTPSGVMFPADQPGVLAVTATSCPYADVTDLAAGSPTPGGTTADLDETRFPGAVFGTDPSCYGDGLSLAAPGAEITSADITGVDGANDGTQPDVWDNTLRWFDGTSPAAALVAGAAALLKSRYSALTASQIKRVLERTSDLLHPKLTPGSTDPYGPYHYIDVTRQWPGPGSAPHSDPNPWHEETGFGRINVRKALDFADVMIREGGGDTGSEPYDWTGWDGGCDAIVSQVNVSCASPAFVTPAEFSAAAPGGFGASYDSVRIDYMQSSTLQAGSTNYIYLRVKNQGPAVARNVTATVVLATIAAGFDYPNDYDGSGLPADYVNANENPLDLGTLDVGEEKIAKLSVAVPDPCDHLCFLGRVRAENDYGFERFEDYLAQELPSFPALQSGQSWVRNNLVKKNLNVVPAPPAPAPPGPTPPGGGKGFRGRSPFLIGTKESPSRRSRILVQPAKRDADKGIELRLALDGVEKEFVRFDLRAEAKAAERRQRHAGLELDDEMSSVELAEQARLELRIGGLRTVLDLGVGSKLFHDAKERLTVLEVKHGKVVLEGKKRYVELAPNGSVLLARPPFQRSPIAVEGYFPPKTKVGTHALVHVFEFDEDGTLLGDVNFVFVATKDRPRYPVLDHRAK